MINNSFIESCPQFGGDIDIVEADETQLDTKQKG